MAHYRAVVLDDRRLELPKGALSLITKGREIEIDVEDNLIQDAVTVADKLAILNKIIERQKERPYTDGSDTIRLIREARAGAMYGYDL